MTQHKIDLIKKAISQLQYLITYTDVNVAKIKNKLYNIKDKESNEYKKCESQIAILESNMKLDMKHAKMLNAIIRFEEGE